jgi:hypothetical protein
VALATLFPFFSEGRKAGTKGAATDYSGTPVNRIAKLDTVSLIRVRTLDVASM